METKIHHKKKQKICIKCGEKGKLNIHGVCSECEKYDQNKFYN